MAIIKYSADEFSKIIDLVSDAQTASGSASTSINDFVSLAKEISSKWINHNCNIEASSVLDRVVYVDAEGKEYGSSDGGKRSEKRYFKDIYKPVNVLPGYSTQYDNKASAVEAQKAYNQSKIDEYNGIASKAKTDLDSKLNDVINKSLEITNNVLTKIKDAIINFEDTYKGLSLKEMWDELDKKDLESISVEEVTLENGEKVDKVYFTYKDENGKTIKLTLPEAVNAFVSYVGAGTSNLIATNMLLEKMGLDPKNEKDAKFIDEYMTKAMLDTNAYVDLVSATGLYGIATSSAMNDFFDDNLADVEGVNGKTIDDAYESVVSKISDDSEIAAGLFGDGTNAKIGFGAAMLPAVMSTIMNVNENDIKERELSSEDKERVKKAEEEAEKNKKNKENSKENKDFSEDGAKQKDKIEQLDENGLIPEGIDGEGEEPIDGEIDEEIEEPNPEPNPNPDSEEVPKISDEDAKAIKKQIETNEDLDTPDEIEKPEITSDDIDNQARDKFYEEKTKGDTLNTELAQERMKAVEEYNNMSDEQKISALEGLGYTGIAAAGLVADQASGQTAYMIGLENQQLANMSNDLAVQQGFMNHDTRYDDPRGMDYFSSGQASLDLTPVSKDVQVARANLDQAKSQYDSSVTAANKAINDATASKEKYNNVLKNIRSTSGNNPKDWTEEQVKEYNKAAREYNEAVDRANGAVKEADSKKTNYAKQKEQYNVAYEKYREEAEKALQQVKENDNADEIGASIGEPSLPSGDDLGDTFVVGDDLVIGNVPSGEQVPENPVNNDDEPAVPNTDGVVYEDE